MKALAALFGVALAVGAAAQAPEAGPDLPTKLVGCRPLSDPIRTPGTYVLANNLPPTGVQTGDCLVLTTDFVTINLAGFTMAGDGTGTGIRATRAALRGIAVRNGTITGFEAGLNLGVTAGAIVEGLRVVQNTFGIITGGVVRGNIATANSSGGLIVVGTVEDNYVDDNGGFGIFAFNGSTVSDNTATRNRDVGISVGNGSSTVTGNTATGNSGHGIVVGKGSTIVSNTADDNGGAGFTVECPSNLLWNTAGGNAGGQFVLTDESRCNRHENLSF